MMAAASEQVASAVPLAWDEILDSMSSIASAGREDVILEDKTVGPLYTMKVRKELLFLIRLRLVMHVCTSLGHQQYLRQVGPGVTARSFWPNLLIDYASKLVGQITEAIGKHDETAGPTFQLYLIFQRSRQSFTAFMEEWAKAAMACNKHCEEHCGKSFQGRREGMITSLLNMPAKDAGKQAYESKSD